MTNELTAAVARVLARHGQSRWGITASVQAAPDGMTQITGLYRLDHLVADLAAVIESARRDAAPVQAAVQAPVQEGVQ